jgi:hypothetical protein
MRVQEYCAALHLRTVAAIVEARAHVMRCASRPEPPGSDQARLWKVFVANWLHMAGHTVIAWNEQTQVCANAAMSKHYDALEDDQPLACDPPCAPAGASGTSSMRLDGVGAWALALAKLQPTSATRP